MKKLQKVELGILVSGKIVSTIRQGGERVYATHLHVDRNQYVIRIRPAEFQIGCRNLELGRVRN